MSFAQFIFTNYFIFLALVARQLLLNDERFTGYVKGAFAFPTLAVSESTISRIVIKKTPWSESASELYRPSDRRLSAKRLPTFADRGYHVVSVTDPYGCILVF
jgi:hypothetical protein